MENIKTNGSSAAIKFCVNFTFLQCNVFQLCFDLVGYFHLCGVELFPNKYSQCGSSKFIQRCPTLTTFFFFLHLFNYYYHYKRDNHRPAGKTGPVLLTLYIWNFSGSRGSGHPVPPFHPTHSHMKCIVLISLNIYWVLKKSSY